MKIAIAIILIIFLLLMTICAEIVGIKTDNEMIKMLKEKEAKNRKNAN